MKLLDPILNLDCIVTLKKDLDKLEPKNNSITLTRGTILGYQNINKYTETSYEIHYMGLGSRIHNHKVKLNKDTKDDTFGPIQNLGTPEDHKSMKSHFYVITKNYQRPRKQGSIGSEK